MNGSAAGSNLEATGTVASEGGYVRFDGMTWPRVNAASELQWKLRYGVPTREDHLFAASVIAAYLQLIDLDAKTRNARVARLREPASTLTTLGRLPVPAPETEETTRLVARVEELTRQLADVGKSVEEWRIEGKQVADELKEWLTKPGPGVDLLWRAIHLLEPKHTAYTDPFRAALEVQP